MSAADDAAEAAKLDAELEAAVVDASGAAGEDDGEVSPAKVLRFPLFPLPTSSGCSSCTGDM